MVDATDQQKNAYVLARNLLHTFLMYIRQGLPLNVIFRMARELLAGEPEIMDYFSVKVGVVTRGEFKNEQMVISEKSETVVIPGKSFYVTTGFCTSTWAVCIGETCFLPLEGNKQCELLTAKLSTDANYSRRITHGCELLTAKVTTERALISYTLDDPNGVPEPAPTQSAGSTRFGSVSFGPWSFDNSLTYFPSSLFCFPLKSNSGFSPVPVSIYRSQSAFGFHLFLVWWGAGTDLGMILKGKTTTWGGFATSETGFM